ncbi:MAG: gliding motility-associated C-terminal domain-containing protein [Puia sp.]
MKKFIFAVVVLSVFTSNTAFTQMFSVIISGPTDSICSGAAILFESGAENAVSIPSYQWKINGSDVGANDSSFQTSALQNGDVVSCVATVPVSGSADLTAISNKIRILVKTVPSPAIQISISANPFCEGTSVTLTAFSQNAGDNPSYMWNIQKQHVGNGDSIFTTNSFVEGDWINCLLRADNSKCSGFYVVSNLITLKVLPVPVITITGKPIFSNPGATQLTATIVGNPGSFTWSPSTSLDNASILNPVATPQFTTNYLLKVIDQDGCKAQKDYTIKIDRKISVPNAFTPNGDGVNDVFRVFYGSDISQVSLTVYNRWGQLVFVDKGANKGWDGTISGQRQPSGSYVWYFSYRDERGVLNTMRGSVLLIR